MLLEENRFTSRTRIAIMATLIAIATSLLYALAYSFILSANEAALMNVLFILFYGLGLYLLLTDRLKSGKILLPSLFIIQIFLLATFIFPKACGSHLFLVVVPAVAYIIYEQDEWILTVFFSTAAIAAIVIIEFVEFGAPLIELPAAAFQSMFVATVLFDVIGLLLVIKIFVDDLLQAKEELSQLAMKDELTGLYNRRHLLYMAERHINFCRRYSGQLSVIMIDIDYFKTINDTYGHAAGDLVLKRLATILETNSRVDCDIVARFGGEEFLLLLPSTGLEAAKLTAERLRNHVEKEDFKLNGKTIKVTISCGVAGYGSDTVPDVLFECADKAMYEAKRSGRNRVVVMAESLIANETA